MKLFIFLANPGWNTYMIVCETAEEARAAIRLRVERNWRESKCAEPIILEMIEREISQLQLVEHPTHEVVAHEENE